jgi:hypothetical protein
MGLFSRRKQEAAPAAWQPPTPPHCACTRHLDDALMAEVVPFAVALEMDDEPPATVAELLGPGGLSVRPADGRDQVPDLPAALTWNLGVYDDARVHYDDTEDGAVLDLAEALAEVPGIDQVEWDDREVFLLAAPTLCAEGVLAAAAVTLLDDRVRAPR